MSFIADRMKGIKPSPTMAVNAKAIEMRAAGADVISVGAGEPDFDTPDNVKEAAYRAIREGRTKYTRVDGIPELKAAVAEKFRRDNGLEYEVDQVTVNSGGKHTIYNALMATVNPGDEVVIARPYWVSYPDMVRLTGGEPVFVDASLETGFKVTPELLDAALSERSKWFIFNSPANPSGMCYTGDEIRALAEVLVRYPDVHVMSDDIYEHIVYDDFKFEAVAHAAPELYERTLTMNGVAKGYSMTGWRIGFAGGPKELIRAIAKVQSQSTSNPCTISQWASVEALTGPQDFIPERVAIFRERRDLILSMVNQIPGMTCPRPEGAFYIYPDISELIGRKTPDGDTIEDDAGFVDYLLGAEGVAAVPGAAFGLSPNFRISYALATDQLEEAGKRLQRACSALD